MNPESRILNDTKNIHATTITKKHILLIVVKVLFEALERQIRAWLRQISENNIYLMYFTID
jgi:hypothetical protein